MRAKQLTVRVRRQGHGEFSLAEMGFLDLSFIPDKQP